MTKTWLKFVACLLSYSGLLLGCRSQNSKTIVHQDKSTISDSFFNSYMQQDRGKKFSVDIILLDKSGDNFPISTVTHATSKLVLRFSRYNCWHCVEECIIALRNIIKDSLLHKNDVLLICSDYEIRGFRLLCKDKVQDFNAYQINKNIGLTLEKLNTPFFFVIDSSKNILQPFVPIEGKISNTEKYLKRVATKE